MAAPLVTAAVGELAGEATGSGSGGGMVSETVNLVSGVITGLADFIATAIPTRLDTMRKQRIKELQASFEAGNLGLTTSQQQEIETLGAGGIQATQKEFFQRQADISRVGPTSPTGLALAAQAQAEGLRRQESELQRALLAAERGAEAAQLAELQTLKAEQRARNEEIKGAATKFLSLGLATGAKAADIGEARRQTFGTSVTPTGSPPGSVGITEAEIAALGLTPEQVSYLKSKGLM